MQTKDTPAAPATILHFPRKRGRPRSSRPRIDTGTPELVIKRLIGDTAEALDLCLERNIITPEQHWCGVHLRWLYTLRYGAPGVRAIDPTHLGGQENKLDDPEWRMAREQEYTEAMKLLYANNIALPIINICIYNDRPHFLNIHAPVTTKSLSAAERSINTLCTGLDILSDLWRSTAPSIK